MKVLAQFLQSFKRQCRQFLLVSCFKMVGFHGQHLKVSAVALQLQSTLGATFSIKRAPKVDSSKRPGAPWSRPGRDLAPKTVQGHILINLGPFLADIGMILAHLLALFNRLCRQFRPASCFKVFGFHGQHLKVSAVALQLQSTLV